MVNSGKHIVPQFPQRLKVSPSTLTSKVFVKKRSETIYVFSWFHFFKDSTLSTWSLETQSDPFIHSHRFVSEVSKFDVNFILWQSIFSKVLSLRLSRRDLRHISFSPPRCSYFIPAVLAERKWGKFIPAPFRQRIIANGRQKSQ